MTVPAYWVTFNTAGGTQVDSKYVAQGDSIDLSEVGTPTKQGYTFAGWQTPEGIIVSDSYTPTASVVLTAQWTAANVTYTVVYWGENADDEDYSVLATDASKTALTGDTVSSTSYQTLPSGTTDRDYFTFNDSKTESITILADGSSVLNVYFKRNAYIFTFKRNGTTIYSFKAKYQADISGKWSFTGTDGNTYPETRRVTSWVPSGSSTYTVRIISMERMPAENITFSYYSSNDTTRYFHYYVESLGDGTRSFDGKNFDLYSVLKNDYNVIYYNDDFFLLQGFTRYAIATESGTKVSISTRGTRWDDSWNSKLYFYYTRNSYTLMLNNYGDETTQAVQYGASLSPYDTVPSRPSGFSENAEFKGWYQVQPSQITDSTAKFDFTTHTMPAGDQILYAYWAEPKIDVGITITIDEKETHYEEEGLPQGTTIASTGIYQEALVYIAENNLTLLRWVDGDNVPVDINKPLYGNITIKPIFVGQKYTLTYKAGEGTGADVVDANEYGPDASARVANSTFTAPAGKVFAYWTDTAYNIYYPGNYLTLNKDTTLTAVYVDTYAKVSVTYKANGGTGSDYTTESVLNNGKVTVLGNGAVGIEPQTGYHFVSWDTKANGSGTSFEPGKEARLNSTGENVLYAIWAANTDVSYTVHYYKEGTDTKVADDKVVTGKTFNTPVTESAVTVTGYTVVKPEAQTFTLDAYKKEITFYYTANNYTYKVNYYLDGVEQASMQATGTAAYGTQVTTYTDKRPAGYVLDKTENLPLTIQVDQSKNVINVYYKKNVFTLTVNYVYEDGKTAADTHTETVTYGAAYSVTSPAIDGYVPSTAVVKGTMPAENKTVTVTYTKRTDLSYTVHYVWNNTTTQVADDKVVTGQTFADVVSETPITVNGYTPYPRMKRLLKSPPAPTRSLSTTIRTLPSWQTASRRTMTERNTP